MTEHSPPRPRLEDLLSQDSRVVSFPFEEFRMNLQVSIQELELKARKVRIASYWGLAATIVCMLSILPVIALRLDNGQEWVGRAWAICGQIAFWTTGILAYLYTYKYKPAIDRAKNDLQTTILAQLQSQVAELSRKIDAQSKP